jgi:serine/threonine-protein kinase HipA
MEAVEEQFRRMVFNVVARNQDDHVKNIAFLMDRRGQWSLAPAFDVMYAYNPSGAWTARHQMSLAGKREGFTLDDLKAVAATASMKRGRAEAITREVTAAVARWREFASAARVAERQTSMIAAAHRLGLGQG